MDDKTMCNDLLNNIKAELSLYATAICETNNPELRQAFKQIRDDDESFQYELYKVAEVKGYYKPAGNAPETDVQTLYNNLKTC